MQQNPNETPRPVKEQVHQQEYNDMWKPCLKKLFLKWIAIQEVVSRSETQYKNPFCVFLFSLTMKALLHWLPSCSLSTFVLQLNSHERKKEVLSRRRCSLVPDLKQNQSFVWWTNNLRRDRIQIWWVAIIHSRWKMYQLYLPLPKWPEGWKSMEVNSEDYSRHKQ